jgi:hypothetical protein
METLEIQVPDGKTRLVKEFLKELGVTIKVKSKKELANPNTLAAMKELRDGKGVRFKSVEELFNSI